MSGFSPASNQKKNETVTVPTLLWIPQYMNNIIWLHKFVLGGHLYVQKIDTSFCRQNAKYPRKWPTLNFKLSKRTWKTVHVPWYCAHFKDLMWTCYNCNSFFVAFVHDGKLPIWKCGPDDHQSDHRPALLRVKPTTSKKKQNQRYKKCGLGWFCVFP